jgi:hypothetical protein
MIDAEIAHGMGGNRERMKQGEEEESNPQP